MIENKQIEKLEFCISEFLKEIKEKQFIDNCSKICVQSF